MSLASQATQQVDLQYKEELVKFIFKFRHGICYKKGREPEGVLYEESNDQHMHM